MNPTQTFIRLTIVVSVAAILALSGACSGKGHDLAAAEQVRPRAGTGFGLPTPASVKGSSYVSSGLVRTGSEHLLPTEFHAKWISDSQGVCTYNPDWEAGSEERNRLALAAYAFTVGDGFDAAQRIEFTLPQAGDEGDMWVGLSNWESDRWDWYNPVDCRVETPLAGYVNPESGEMLVVAAFTGGDPWQVETITVGGNMVLDGYVYAGDGVTPLEGVEVHFSDRELQIGWSTYTDADGYWSKSWRSFRGIDVSADLSGWEFSPVEQVAIIDGKDIHLEPFVGTPLPEVNVAGFVYLEDGETPVAGCPVRAWGASDFYEVTTDEQGFYRFNEVFGGDLLVRPATLEYSFAPAEQEFRAMESVLIDPFLATPQTAHTVDGYVIREDDSTPIAGAHVSIYYYGQVVVSESVDTDETGYWSIPGLYPHDYTVYVHLTGYEFTPTSQPVTVVDRDLTVDTITGTCPPQYRLSGYVRDEAYQPVAGVKIEIVNLILYHTAYTDESGYWEVPEVFEGSYSVHPYKVPCRFNPYDAWVEMDRNRSVSFTAIEKPTYTVEGCIVDQQTYEPIADAEVRFSNSSGELVVPVDAGGCYTAQLPNGTWYVRPRSDYWSFEPISRTITIDDAPVTMELFYAYPGGGG